MRQFITKVPILFLFLLFVMPFCIFAQTENWLYEYDGPMSGDDAANDITYGADGNIYVAGYSSSSNGTYQDLLVISLTTSGDTNWLYRYNAPDDNNEVANAIVYGEDGNIYVAGYIVRSPVHHNDLVVISLTTMGDTNWTYTYDGPNSGDDAANDIVYGGDGNIYVAGYCSADNPVHTDLLVISLTILGDTNWVYRYNPPDDFDEVANAIVYGGDSNIYVTGYIVRNPIHHTDLVVISLAPTIIGARELGVFSTKYNMFGPTIVSGPLLLPKGDRCRVFDITGRVVAPDRLRPGIYFVEVDNEITHKVVKVE